MNDQYIVVLVQSLTTDKDFTIVGRKGPVCASE
jgi:hypothetical protein